MAEIMSIYGDLLIATIYYILKAQYGGYVFETPR
jgi:hypothetical protein